MNQEIPIIDLSVHEYESDIPSLISTRTARLIGSRHDNSFNFILEFDGSHLMIWAYTYEVYLELLLQINFLFWNIIWKL